MVIAQLSRFMFALHIVKTCHAGEGNGRMFLFIWDGLISAACCFANEGDFGWWGHCLQETKKQPWKAKHALCAQEQSEFSYRTPLSSLYPSVLHRGSSCLLLQLPQLAWFLYTILSDFIRDLSWIKRIGEEQAGLFLSWVIPIIPALARPVFSKTKQNKRCMKS
jgi:hypothetical protein